MGEKQSAVHSISFSKLRSSVSGSEISSLFGDIEGVAYVPDGSLGSECIGEVNVVSIWGGNLVVDSLLLLHAWVCSMWSVAERSSVEFCIVVDAFGLGEMLSSWLVLVNCELVTRWLSSSVIRGKSPEGVRLLRWPARSCQLLSRFFCQKLLT